MYKYSPVGERVRHFRTHQQISQSKLELEIGASFGSLSRIENGQTNPTKETLLKISNALNLNSKETAYLLGIATSLPSKKESIAAMDYVKEYFEDKDRIAYLVDDLRFIYSYSIGICNLFKIEKSLLDKELLGINIVEILLNPGPITKSIFYEKKHKEILAYQIGYFKYLNQYREHEKWYKEIKSKILNHPYSKKLWESNLPIEYSFQSQKRYVWVKIDGRPKKIYYMRTPIITSPRFEIIEYYS